MQKPLLRKRCFVQMTGYEPISSEHGHRRFTRDGAVSQSLEYSGQATGKPIVKIIRIRLMLE
jgi:hypothetical protein